MTKTQTNIVERIVMSHMCGTPKDADHLVIDEKRGEIHSEMFIDAALEDVSAADLTDYADEVISTEGWRIG